MNKNLQKVLLVIEQDPVLKEKHYELFIGSHTGVIRFLKEVAEEYGICLDDSDFAPGNGNRNKD